MFTPDYRHCLDAAMNKKPRRLPIYEHVISPFIMEKILECDFASLHDSKNDRDIDYFFENYCKFFHQMTYDTVSYEVCIVDILPGHGALKGGRPGPIQSEKDFQDYPWEELPQLYYSVARPRFDALVRNLPEGMKAVGGVGNGVFEISEDLVGLEYLAYMQADNPKLFGDLYSKIGELTLTLWKRFLDDYAEHFAVCRFGDDLGFKSGTLVSPAVIRSHILPQYKKIIRLIASCGKAFLWHSCGCIFDIMPDVIALGINAKHSNEDGIARFDRWIELYGDQIGLFGGFDVDLLCQKSPEEITMQVIEDGRRFRETANGYALGSGNSIPEYVPVEGYLAMIRAANELRRLEE